MDSNSVFDYWNALDYLKVRFSKHGKARGMRMVFAEKINTSTSYITKVLAGDLLLPIKHVPVINRLLEHNEQESDFFMLLVLYSQSETKETSTYFKEKLNIILKERRASGTWIPNKTELSVEAQVKYYSQWYYIVIHILTSVPKYQTREAIAERLKLPLPIVTSALHYLEKIDLITKNGDHYQNANRRVHVSKDSDWVHHLHTNTRHLAMQKLATPTPDDVHYSWVIALSLKDIEKTKIRIQQIFRELELVSQNTDNEDVYGFSLDFFRV